MGILTDIQNVGASERSPDTLERRNLKAAEELGELAEAILSATSKSGAKGKTWMDIIEEAVDLSIMGIDIAMTKPPGNEHISDDAWRDVVKKIFALKLKKWVKQVEDGKTLIAKGTVEIHAERAERGEYVTIAYLDGEPIEVRKEGCGKIIGHGIICGRGMLCVECDPDFGKTSG